MAPEYLPARKQLSYPLYGASFDPSNSDFLVVGGGGGSTSSGVPNKITLLDVSRLGTISEVADIDLAKNEDSVTSLAVADSDDGALTAYAGINSSVKDQEAGKNEHFRSFRIGLPAKKKKVNGSEKVSASTVSGTVKTQALTRAALFTSATGPKSDSYQRVLRVSTPHRQGGERLAAIACGLGSKNEVLVLRATPSPGLSNVISRIDIEGGEANDLDLLTIEDERKSHVLAYCTDYEIYLQPLPSASSKDITEPVKVFTSPRNDQRLKIRGLRWLNERYFVCLCNKPAGGGAELVVFKAAKDYKGALLTLLRQLPKTTKQAVGLTTVALSVSEKGEQQSLVAVAGQDSSIEILSIDMIPGTGMAKFRQYAHLRDVHAGPITSITFSHWQAPPLPVSKDTKPQYIRLASVGVDLNVVVSTLPLRPFPAVYTKQPRYVLTAPSQLVQNTINVSIATLVILAVAFCLQVFCELRGYLPPTLNAQSWLPAELQHKLAIPYRSYAGIPPDGMPGPVIVDSLPPIISSASSAVSVTAEKVTQVADAAATMLQDLVAEAQLNPGQAIVMRDTTDQPGDGNVGAELHHQDSAAVKKDESIKKWDQLSEKEKRGWKKRLVDAGQWTEKQGETILKGILFSELGAAVGAAVRG